MIVWCVKTPVTVATRTRKEYDGNVLMKPAQRVNRTLHRQIQRFYPVVTAVECAAFRYVLFC